MKKNILVILSFVMLCMSACANKDLYTGTDEPDNKKTDTTAVKVITSAPYLYPFADETQNAIAEITIKTKEDVDASKLTVNLPYLKYNKSWLMMLTQDDCRQSSYCRTWAKMNGKPVSNSTGYVGDHDLFYDYLQFVNGDLPPNVIIPAHSLGYTDGAGNEVRFSFTATLLPENKVMNAVIDVKKGFTDNFYRFYNKYYMVWYDVMEMMNYGVGIAFHDVAATDAKNTADVLAHLKISQDSIINRLSGRGCKFLAVPNGNETYVDASRLYSDLQTITGEAWNIDLYPFHVDTDLKGVIVGREFNDSAFYFKGKILNQLTLPKEDRKAITLGVHNTDNSWMELLQWVNDNYGQGGDDSVWFPSQDEYYEYNYYRIHGTQKVEQIDKRTIKLIVTLSSGTYFYYPSVTVNLAGLSSSSIESVSTNDAITGLSYAKYGDGMMFNVDCRKHLLDMATHYVTLYESDKTNTYYKSDAIYFVNKLKSSPEKDALLKRIHT